MQHRRHQRAFLKAYSPLFDRVYRYVRARCTDADECNDIVADIMVKAYERLDSYDATKGNMEQWIMGIAKFTLIDYWRTRRVHLALDDATDAPAMATAPVTSSLDDELSFEHRIRGLPEESKTLLRLRYVDDMSYETLAELTGKQPSSVRSWFSRIHQHLRISDDV